MSEYEKVVMVWMINDGLHKEMDYSDVGLDSLYCLFFCPTWKFFTHNNGYVTIAVKGLHVQILTYA